MVYRRRALNRREKCRPVRGRPGPCDPSSPVRRPTVLGHRRPPTRALRGHLSDLPLCAARGSHIRECISIRAFIDVTMFTGADWQYEPGVFRRHPGSSRLHRPPARRFLEYLRAFFELFVGDACLLLVPADPVRIRRRWRRHDQFPLADGFGVHVVEGDVRHRLHTPATCRDG